MKKIVYFLSASLLLVNFAFGQLSENLRLYAGGGISQPSESFLLKDFLFENQLGQPTSATFDKFWNLGLNIDAGLEYSITPTLGARLGFSYSNFSINDEEVRSEIRKVLPSVIQIVDFNANRGTVNIYAVALSARLQFPLHFITPYLIGGIGFMHINAEPVEISSINEPQDNSFSFRFPEDKADAFMNTGGAGIAVNVSQNLHPYVEGSYNLGLTEKDNTIYYSARVGMLFDIR